MYLIFQLTVIKMNIIQWFAIDFFFAENFSHICNSEIKVRKAGADFL